MISANGGLPAHRYTPQVTQRSPRGSEPASGFTLDLLGGLGYVTKEGDSSTREGNCRHPLIGVGGRFHHSGVLPSPRQGLLDKGHGLMSRIQMALGIRCERVD